MKRTLLGMAEVGEQLIRDAIEANRLYLQAEEEGKPASEIEQLRLLAESLYQAVTDFQLRKHEGMTPMMH